MHGMKIPILLSPSAPMLTLVGMNAELRITWSPRKGWINIGVEL